MLLRIRLVCLLGKACEDKKVTKRKTAFRVQCHLGTTKSDSLLFPVNSFQFYSYPQNVLSSQFTPRQSAVTPSRHPADVLQQPKRLCGALKSHLTRRSVADKNLRVWAASAAGSCCNDHQGSVMGLCGGAFMVLWIRWHTFGIFLG